MSYDATGEVSRSDKASTPLDKSFHSFLIARAATNVLHVAARTLFSRKIVSFSNEWLVFSFSFLCPLSLRLLLLAGRVRPGW